MSHRILYMIYALVCMHRESCLCVCQLGNFQWMQCKYDYNYASIGAFPWIIYAVYMHSWIFLFSS